MKEGNTRHIFPGGNTSKGFFSYYDYILPQTEANHIFCLKGGPGVGKSTFMRKIGDAMVKKGYDVEYLHCSSDNGSLDGVSIPKIGIALLDGTAPHVVDPKNPGAVDEIINLGEYWDLKGIKENKDNILKINRDVGITFRRAYKYLAAAKSVYDDMKDIYSRATNSAGTNIEAEKFISNELFFLPIGDTEGRCRKQFASAITPDGLVDYLDTIIPKDFSVYSVNGVPGTGACDLIGRIAKEAVIRGLDIETYYCPMEPDTKIEHLLIPQLALALTTTNKYHMLDCEHTEVIDMSRYVDQSILVENEAALEFDQLYYDLFIGRAIFTISGAKQAHDLMETFYVPYMDFDKVQAYSDKILERILEYTK